MDNFTESYPVHWVHPQIFSAFDEQHQHDLYENEIRRTLNPHRTRMAKLDKNSDAPASLKAALKDFNVDPGEWKGTVGELETYFKDIRMGKAQQFSLDHKKLADAQIYYSLFPNCILSLHPESMLLLQTLPHKNEPEKCILKPISLACPDDDQKTHIYHFGDESR